MDLFVPASPHQKYFTFRRYIPELALQVVFRTCDIRWFNEVFIVMLIFNSGDKFMYLAFTINAVQR